MTLATEDSTWLATCRPFRRWAVGRGVTQLPEEDEWYCHDCIDCAECGARCPPSEIERLLYFKKAERGSVKLCHSCFERATTPAEVDCGSCRETIKANMEPFSVVCANCEATVHADCLYPGQNFCRACFA